MIFFKYFKSTYLAWLCRVPGAGPKCLTASLALRGPKLHKVSFKKLKFIFIRNVLPDNKTQFSPFGALKAN